MFLQVLVDVSPGRSVGLVALCDVLLRLWNSWLVVSTMSTNCSSVGYIFARIRSSPSFLCLRGINLGLGANL